jgi:glutamyl peptidase. Serine peptidase. MEROPS family S09D
LTQWQIALDQPAAPRQLFKRNIQDGYNDPGAPLRSFNRYGRATAHVDQGALLLAGDGASPEGDRPFLRRFDLGPLRPPSCGAMRAIISSG